jgi:hypothetical protein
LILTPDPAIAARLLAGPVQSDFPIEGPAIQVTTSLGDTSGRFSVARVIARIFPSERAFVDRAIAEGIAPASGFPFGPYPQDSLSYRNDRVAIFETPSRAEGLGTASRLAPDNDPISGMAVLAGHTPDLVQVSIRLPPALRGLSTPILEQLERSVADAYR